MSTVAELIQVNLQAIISAWLREVRASASAKGLEHAALENVMPLFLGAVAEHLATGDEEAGRRRRLMLQNHLSTRLRQGFDLAEIVGELVVLGRSISPAWAHLPESERPSYEEIERLHLEIHNAIVDATDTFHTHMLQDEQSEKRFIRQLQTIANAALEDATRPLRDRLRDMLEVVMDALDAQCAAFLRYSVSKQQLELVACAGMESLEPYAASLDPRSFVGQLAAHEDAQVLLDTHATTLDIPEDLRRDGIHSLLGVRLPLLHDLVGVLYIGTTSEREFMPREIRRIEALGERFALHLEHARLFAELADKVDALHVEKAMRERFVSVLVHDLRGPLGYARLATESLSRGTHAADIERYAPKILHGLDRIDRMVRDLLDANRLRAGEALHLHLDAIDLAALVNEAAQEARAMYGDRFIVDAPAASPGVWSYDELYRALWNLVANAVKYGDRMRPITLRVVRSGDRVRLSVHNEGTPIPADQLPLIFDSYARAPSASTNSPGWGLGLALVRACAEAHGGTVDVTSDAGAGTTFTIELPVDARAVRAR